MPRGATFRGQPLLANHQKSWLWGTIPVWETLHASRWPVYELVLSTNASQPIHEKCREMARKNGIPVRQESSARLKQLCGAKDHQGILALMGPFPYVPLKQILNSTNSAATGSGATGDVIVVLDRLQDPFNVGAIVRSAAALGAQGLVLGTDSQVGITSHVARSSVGTVNQIPICRIKSLRSAIEELGRNQYQILAATLDATTPVAEIHPQHSSQRRRYAIIIGNEASGVSPDLIGQCDTEIAIPMKGTAESLNAAVAAGIILYELTR